MDLIERTWDELGYRIRATGWKVWVRTLPHERKVGSLWLPPRRQSLYGELPHLVTVRGVVLSAGPRGRAGALNPGDVIAFCRVHFAWWARLRSENLDEYGGDDVYVGYINAEDIFGVVEEGESVRPIQAEGAAATATVG